MIAMLDAVILALAFAVSLLTCVLYACLAASVKLFRFSPAAAGPAVPMTLIKPVRGLDDGLAANFESIARADPAGVLQVIIALESRSDPAYPVAAAFAAGHPERDIAVLVTGDSGGRMGKMHNMIEALPKAKHPFVVFSDADIETTARLVAETSRAFNEGYDAAYALPRHRPGGGVGGLLFQAALNHSFGLPAALSWQLGGFRFCAGAWMGFTRAALERAGGLEPLAQAIADDFALSDRIWACGARAKLMPVPVPLRETGTGLRETLRHLAKWSAIIRWTLPRLYLALPLANLGLLSLILWGLCESSGRHVALGRGLALAAFASRGLVAFLQDLWTEDSRLPALSYVLLALADLGALGFWLSGFRREILWRGVRYRLHPGGRAEVVASPPGARR